MCGVIFGVILPVGAVWWMTQLDSTAGRVGVFLLGFVGYPKLVKDSYRGMGRLPDVSVDPRQDGLAAVAFSPDGTLVATGGADCTVRIADARTGEDTGADRSAPGGWVMAVAFTPDGRSIVTGSADGLAQRWDAATGAELATMSGHTAPLKSAAVSPDGRLVATGSIDLTVRLWDAATGEPLAVLTGHSGHVEKVLFSPDGRTLASAGFDGSVLLWDVPSRTRRATLRGHRAQVMALAYSPDGTTLAAGGLGGVVRLWDVATGTLTGSRNPGGRRRVLSLAWGRDVLAIGCASGIIKLRPAPGTPDPRFLNTGTRLVNALAFHPDGTTLAAADGNGHLHLWHNVTTTPAP
ncbi:WD40 repeat domain-containing protein [Dactylosporangium maewongense]|uniref:WD40 repeat domain-containing protein n=1 Tax=Dactylosporangium maewongense TaxID=634393 RepID=UPI0031DB6E23